MATLNLGILVNDMHGKAGTAVFVHTKEGTVARTRVKPRNPKTSAQGGVRSNFSRSATAYKNLTTAQATAWTNYGLSVIRHSRYTGKAYRPSGINIFTALGSKFLQVNPTGTLPVTPPASGFAGDSITVSASGSSGKVVFTASAANAANVTTELLLQPLTSRNRTPQAKGYRTKAFVAFVTGTLTANVTVPAGLYVPAYRFVSTLTGQEVGMVTLAQVTVS